MESKCHNFLSSAKIHKFSKMYFIHIYIYLYKSFSTTLDKGLRKNIKKKKKRCFWWAIMFKNNMMIFYFYLVCFTFSISYSVLPFHLVYVLQFLHLFFFLNVLSQAFIRCSKKAFVYMYICIYMYAYYIF